MVINPHWQINRKHIDIRGVWGIDFSHFYKAIHVMAKHSRRFGWHRLISQVYTLGQVQNALEDVESLRIFKAVIAPNEG